MASGDRIKQRTGLFHYGTLCKLSFYKQRQRSPWKPGSGLGPHCPGGDECPAAIQKNPGHPGAKFPQYSAALAASMGALASGSNQGWSGPIINKVTGRDPKGFDFPVSVMQADWMNSAVSLGAAFVCFPIGIIMDTIGRKRTMLLLVVPFTCGWALVTFGKSPSTLILGRFVTGVAGGAFCVIAPAYTSEISQQAIRGTLGSFFNLMITLGILLAFTVGGQVSIFVFNVFCACIPVVFCFVFFFMPESPKYLVMKGKYKEARVALVRLRGKKFDVDKELDFVINRIETQKKNKKPCLLALREKAALRTMLICFTLMIFQQTSGLIAMHFNAIRIFNQAGISIHWTISTIILGTFQVVAAFITCLFVDKIGRRILLLMSALVMCGSNFIMGTCFFLQQILGRQHVFVQAISWLPLACLFQFITAFSIGFGPIPWLMAGELCQMNIKAFVASAAGTLSWLLSFASASSFSTLNRILGPSIMFWTHSVFMLAAFIFVFYVVPETKGKSIEEIQLILLSDPRYINQTRKPVPATAQQHHEAGHPEHQKKHGII